MKFTLLLFVILSFVSQYYSASVKCADGSTCPNGQTCCEIGGFGYGCCPYPEGVCCSDKKHCCPSGSGCDTSNGQCGKAAQFTTFFKLAKATPADTTCSDGTTCPGDSTCCQVATGGYGCCPYAQATCCSDKAHCCPEGLVCDIPDGKCVQKSKTRVFKVGQASAISKVSDVPCADGTSCSDGYTCCPLSGGGYGCCPYANAVCCSDQIHCCPASTTCDLSSGTCIPSLRSLSLISNPQKALSSNQCANGARCAGDEICCQKGNSGDYGCCPYNPGVCCGDGQNCCPLGYACDLSAGECVSQRTGDRFLVTTASISKK